MALNATLRTEMTLGKNKSCGDVYKWQIQDMVDGEVVCKVPERKLTTYNGPINYFPHLTVQNPKSKSTPVGICFKASRAQGVGKVRFRSWSLSRGMRKQN